MKITITGSNITSCSYYFDEKEEINGKNFESLVTTEGKEVSDENLVKINSQSGYSFDQNDCETGNGYKIVLVVTTTDGKKTIVVGGYYVPKS